MAKITPYIIALFVGLIWGAMTCYIIARAFKLVDTGINSPDMTAISGMYAAITGTFSIVLNFFFGSSASSRAKDETIATIAKQT
jgi:hypothetical protein